MWIISLPIILSTFGLIFLAELPDKTAIATLVLATRYRASQVILGTWLALLIQTAIAVLAGSLLTLLPHAPVRIASGIGFLIFAYLAFKENEPEEEAEEKEAVEKVAKKHQAAWITSFLVVFAAEWGDLTQLATAALVAHGGHALSIGIGALLGLWAVTLLAALLGQQLKQFIRPKLIARISALLFALVGIGIIVSAFFPNLL